MTHHGGNMSGKEQESSERVQKQRAFEEGRGHDVARSTMTTGMGGPEAGAETNEIGQGPHTMEQEEPSTRESSKQGAAMAGSRGTEGTVSRGKGSQRGRSQE